LTLKRPCCSDDLRSAPCAHWIARLKGDR
jgi:hypothetical protein